MNKLRSHLTVEKSLSKTAKARIDTENRLLANENDIEKGFTLPVNPEDGLALFPIEPEVLKPFEKDLPLQALIPEVSQTGGIGFGYKVIDAWDNSGYSGKVQDGRRARFLQTAVRNVTHLFKTIGFENYFTDNAGLSSENMARQSQAVNIVLQTLAYMIAEEEERKIIGGNSTALEEIANITATESNTAGSFTAGDYNVIAVPLTLYGLEQSSVTKGVRLTHEEPNADGTVTRIVGGYGVKKAVADEVTLTANKGIDILIEDVASAAGYAVFVGATGSEKLVYVGPTNKVTITAPAATNAQLASALSDTDQSEDLELDWNGLFAMAGHGNGVVISLDGAPLTVEGIYASEFEEVISIVKDRGVDITHMVMNRKTFSAYYKAVATGISLTMEPTGNAPAITLGGKPEFYESAHVNGKIPFVIDDLMPNGDILFITIGSAARQGMEGNFLEKRVQEAKHVIAWARVTRSYQFGVYETSVLVCRQPSAIGRLKNIGGIK